MSIDALEQALDVALIELKDAHARYLHAARAHVGVLIDIGVTPQEAEEFLGPIDDIEAGQNALVGYIEQMRSLA